MQLSKSLLAFFLKRKYFFLAVISFIFWVGLLYQFDHQYQVKSISVGASQSEPVVGTTTLKGKHIWMIDTLTVAERINTINPSYVVKEVQKKYPNELLIIVRRLYPSAYLDVGNGYILLSKEGNILQKDRKIKQDTIPIISYYQDMPYSGFQVGSRIDKKDIRDVLYFIEVIKSAKEKVVSIDIAGYHMLGLYTDTHEYLFSSEKERELQLYQFKEAIKQFQIQGLKYSRIDFRFDKPVVKF